MVWVLPVMRFVQEWLRRVSHLSRQPKGNFWRRPVMPEANGKR